MYFILKVTSPVPASCNWMNVVCELIHSFLVPHCLPYVLKLVLSKGTIFNYFFVIDDVVNMIKIVLSCTVYQSNFILMEIVSRSCSSSYTNLYLHRIADAYESCNFFRFFTFCDCSYTAV